MLKFVLLVCLVLTVTQAVKYHKSKLQFAQKRSLMVKRQATICGENQFLCTSGECILSEWTCDTQADCADGSDEKECECVCRGDRKFQCHNGHCIPASFVCDLDNDCGDNSDEIDCGKLDFLRRLCLPLQSSQTWAHTNVFRLTTCRPGQVQCDNRCIEESWLCDGEIDCNDAVDEKNCGSTCREDQFQCADGSHCIPAVYECDIAVDCPDGSDEQNCQCDPTTEFRCNNGQCINIDWRCDNDADCFDASDELGCQARSHLGKITTSCLQPFVSDLFWKKRKSRIMLKFVLLVCLVLTVTQAVKYHKSKLQFAQKRSLMTKRQARICGENQFLCTSGECILSEWTCDTQADCADGSDEKECDCVCRGEYKFQCANGNCVPRGAVCDRYNDCGDNSDEADCEPVTCEPDQVQCDTYRCIHESWVCDNDYDCDDGWDESDCGGTCRQDRFPCADGSKCIPIHWECDNDDDCADGSDEAHCHGTCREDQFQCVDGSKCIPASWKCDGGRHCDDESDERDCVCDPETQFKCTNGRCISLDWRCDSEDDCSDSSDELAAQLCTQVCVVTT
ncbi:sortilin-related receptor-like [Pomacea canaliculata]|uniref:sortilin-related receptor-like n=1 Tax=Pomacea canaliculata TaxID=400727 RepID=UPI000D7265F5|nr:sortilin-related receptor-like [Pomacea canaliculata]